jgi:cell division septum initiation protein DivIVA
MAEQSSMHAYLNLTKQRIAEMDATLASLEAKAGRVKAESKPKADQMLADIRKRRDEFQAKLKEHTQAGEAAIQASKAQLESQWHGFEAQVKMQASKAQLESQWHGFERQVKTYFDIVGKQIEQQQATFRDVTAAQAKAWQEAAGKFHSESSKAAAARRALMSMR